MMTIRLIGGITLMVVMMMRVSPTCAGSADEVTPAIVRDGKGNTADKGSKITWGPLPPGQKYSTSQKYNDRGLGPLFSMARGFINTVMPQKPPYDYVLGVLKGSIDITQEYQPIVGFILGFIICVVIGILFMGIFPCVGFCFCCCRCCGCCGGDMKRARKDTDKNYRITFGVILGVATIFVLAGVICVYVTNDQIGTSITEFQDIVGDDLDNMQKFINNTVSDIKFVTSNNFRFTTKVISRDLDNIGVLVGIPVREELSRTGGVGAAVNTILALDKNISRVNTMMKGIDTSVTTLKKNQKTLSDDLDSVATDVNTGKSACGTPACNALDTSGIAMDIDFNQLPDISSNVAKMQSVKDRDITALAMKGKKDFDDIPGRVTRETQTVVTDIKNLLDSFAATIDKQVDGINSLPTQVGDQLKPIEKSANDLKEDIAGYDRYRWIGGLVLPTIALIVVILQAVGVTLSFFSCDNGPEAHERSQRSHSAGQLLMAASGFIFLFAALTMLLCTLLFLVGSLLEKIVCQPLSDPKYEIFDKVVDGPNGMFGHYPLGLAVLQDGTIDLTIASVLNGCKKDGAAFTVLRLDSMFDLDKATNYKKSIDIESQINAINVDLSTVNILSAETKDQLNDFSSAIGIDFNGFKTVLKNPTAKTDLIALKTSLDAIANDPTTPTSAKPSFSSAASKLGTVNSGIYLTVNDGKNKLLNDIKTFETEVANVPTGVTKTIAAAEKAEMYVKVNGSALVKTEAKKYGDRVLGIADSFKDSTVKKMRTEVATCKPIYTLYESVLVVGLCKYIVDSLNGFWFGLGWILFFEVISVIFDIKLAKFLRRMKKPVEAESISMETEQTGDQDSRTSKLQLNSTMGPTAGSFIGMNNSTKDINKSKASLNSSRHSLAGAGGMDRSKQDVRNSTPQPQIAVGSGTSAVDMNSSSTGLNNILYPPLDDSDRRYLDRQSNSSMTEIQY